MKRIGIDARLYSKTGVGVYVRNMLYHLARHRDRKQTYIVYCMEEDAHAFDLPADRFTLRPCRYRWHSYGEQTGYYGMLMQDNLDLMHFTYFSYPILYRRTFVATVHDTILLDHKTGKASTNDRLLYEFKHLVFRNVFSSQIRNAACIITPTDTVRQQLLQLPSTPKGKHIETIYEGIDQKLLQAKPNESLRADLGTGFLLYVGNFYPHKNIERLITAYRLADPAKPLILVGPDDFFSRNVHREILRNGLGDRIHMRHNVSSEDLAYCYSQAHALVHPSLSEGFGLPLIEAAHFGLPVAASDIPVFRELLGAQYARFNPYDVEDMAMCISKTSIAGKRKDYGRLLSRFSFERMTDAIVSIYGTYS